MHLHGISGENFTFSGVNLFHLYPLLIMQLPIAVPGFFVCFLMFWSTESVRAQKSDWRDFANGKSIYANGYIDQPYVVVLPDESWLCVFTTGTLHEGEIGQHVVASRSTNQGASWSEPVAIEPASGPAASWVMPYQTDFGRVYAFYIYNGEEVTTLNGKSIRNDMLGWYCYKYSDDGGQTWSKRYRLPIRKTNVDRGNDWGGDVQIMWGIGKPISYAGGMLFAFTKLGKYMLDQGEGWFVWSENIATEREVEKLHWKLLPEGEEGLRNPAFGSVQEEQNVVSLNNGDLYSMYRTRMGYAADAYSRDGGKSWSLPEVARYADGRKIKNPRACPRIWKCDNGKYLLWYHHHSGDDFSDRNPAWIAGGIEKDGRIHWSQPEIFIYGEDLSYDTGRYSYPDLIEQDGEYWVTTTNKASGRLIPVDAALLEGLWSQLDPGTGPELPAPVADFTKQFLAGQGVIQLKSSDFDREGPLLEAGNPRGGFALELELVFSSLKPGQVLLDMRVENGDGVLVESVGYRQVQLSLMAGGKKGSWTSDPGQLAIGSSHRLSFLVDNGPKVIQVLLDGVLGDGGESRQYGWTRYDPDLGTIRLPERWAVNSGVVRAVKIYKRPLSVSEAMRAQAQALSGE